MIHIIKNSYKLQGTPYGIHEQFPTEIEDKRRLLYLIQKRFRNSGHRTYWFATSCILMENCTYQRTRRANRRIPQRHLPQQRDLRLSRTPIAPSRELYAWVTPKHRQPPQDQRLTWTPDAPNREHNAWEIPRHRPQQQDPRLTETLNALNREQNVVMCVPPITHRYGVTIQRRDVQ